MFRIVEEGRARLGLSPGPGNDARGSQVCYFIVRMTSRTKGLVLF